MNLLSSRALNFYRYTLKAACNRPEKTKTPRKKSVLRQKRLFLEAPPGLEPGVKALQASALPLGYGAVCFTFSFKKKK